MKLREKRSCAKGETITPTAQVNESSQIKQNENEIIENINRREAFVPSTNPTLHYTHTTSKS